MRDLYTERIGLCRIVLDALTDESSHPQTRDVFLRRGADLFKGVYDAQRFSFEDEGEPTEYMIDGPVWNSAMGDEYFHPKFKSFMKRAGRSLTDLSDEDHATAVRVLNALVTAYMRTTGTSIETANVPHRELNH